MTTPAFAAIRELLVPYAPHYTVMHDDATTYDLEEDRPSSRTMFGYLSVSRGGARLVFYPLQVFSILRQTISPRLAPFVKSTCVLAMKSVSSAERTALIKLFAAGHARVVAQRALFPARGYYHKPNVDDTHAVLAKLAGAAITRRAKDIVVALPPKTRVPAILVPRQTSAGKLAFKSITTDEHAALAKLFRGSAQLLGEPAEARDDGE